MINLIIYSIVFFLAAILTGFLREYKTVMRGSSLLTFIASTLLLIQSIIIYFDGTLRFNIYGIKIVIDSLSDFFLLVISLIGLSSSIYSIHYMDLYENKGKAWVYALTYPTFILSMAFIVIVTNFEWFIFFWELMTLSSFILMFFSENKKDIDASLKYYITMHFFNTFPLFLSLGLAYSLVGSFDELTFTNIAHALSVASPFTRLEFTILILIAFMAKAGIVPLHYWLPDAHPAAPSNVSALLSGTMIKVAVYGLVRFIFTIIGLNSVLGYLIAILGITTMIVGKLYAVRENDAKRLLAYCSVGQMGYIWLGIGIGVALIPYGGVYSIVGMIGLFAGLFHVLNHAIFKASLFLTSGSLIYAAGTRDLRKLAGLEKYMKFTALAALFSSLAISGIPPFNGFLSKWLIYLSGYYSGSFILSLGAAMAVFISATTLAVFMKFYNAPFGGDIEPDKPIREVPPSMLAGQWILSGLALLIGIFPILVTGLINKPIGAPIVSTALKFGYASDVYMPVYFTVAVIIVFLASYFLLGPKETVEAETWDCGATKITKSDYRIAADGYYSWFVEKINGFYRLTDWAYEFGKKILEYIVKAYLWLAGFFIKVVDTPYTRVETVKEARKHELMYIDEEVFKPVARFFRNIRILLPGIELNVFAAISFIVIVIIILLYVLL